ncbi:unnamed protein product [Rotaria sp. Silwood1]|nr:unnamed protein product [Rotaria sp. Silwood1]CAF0835700.1 unnamed protein product [Rotaria sp. Silwood1]
MSNTVTTTSTTTTTETTTAVPNPLNTGDNAWMMTSTALVLMMTPALAIFYAGLVHRKNVLNQLFLAFVCMGVIFVQWVLFGFSFAFGDPISVGFGSFDDAALRFNGDRFDPFYCATFPLLTYAAYQGTFAIVTCAIISVCYDPMAHWVWGSNGWLRTYGALDFAGGTVVHILSGVSGITAAVIIGKRHDYEYRPNTAHNLPLTVLGSGLLWVGWLGFNAGSAATANGIASLALVNTNAAAAAGLLTWIFLDLIRGRVSISGACCGPLIGLVAVTPASGFIQPGWALLFGIIPTLLIYIAILYKHNIGIDDTLDVGIMHGGGGIIGAFMTGLFSQRSFNSINGADGAFYGNPIQMWYQLAGILTAIGFSCACTIGILLPLKWTIGIRISVQDEIVGLDWAVHGERWEVVGTENKTTKTTPTRIKLPDDSIPRRRQRTLAGSRSRSRAIRRRNQPGLSAATVGRSWKPAYTLPV